MSDFVRSVAVEIDGFEFLKNRGRSGELLRIEIVVIMRFSLVVVIFFGVVERGGDENGADHELKEEEEDGGSEPAVNDDNLRDFHDWEDDDDVAKR